MNCKKCNSKNLSLVKFGPYNKLICSDCKAFQKFISKEEAFDFNSICVSKFLLIRIDSLLGCLKHRHSTYLEKVTEYKEISEIHEIIKEYTR